MICLDDVIYVWMVDMKRNVKERFFFVKNSCVNKEWLVIIFFIFYYGCFILEFWFLKLIIGFKILIKGFEKLVFKWK